MGWSQRRRSSSSSNQLNNRIYTGRAGTGKSYHVIKDIEELINRGDVAAREVLLLAFDRRTRDDALGKTSVISATNVRTLHSLAYGLLGVYDKLPEGFRDIPDEQDFDGEPLNGYDFDQLVARANRLSNEEILLDAEAVNTNVLKKLPELSQIRLIIVDEAQDFREDFLIIIQRLAELTQCAVWLAGDPYQRIYGFSDELSKHKIADVLINPANYFGKDDFRRIYLRRNHRSTATIQELINGYLSNVFNAPEEEQYEVDDKVTESLPRICFFTTMREEFGFVLREIEKVPEGETVAVISRNNKELRAYRRLRDANKERMIDLFSIDAEQTVHAVKGGEYDHVFIIGFNRDAEDADIDYINYVAVSRAKKTLTVTTAYPKGSLASVFQEGTYILVDRQRPASRPYGKMKKIRPEGRFTKGKLQQGVIDSIDLKVAIEDVPFLRRLRRGTTEKQPYATIEKIETRGCDYSVQRSKGTYVFRFRDLNRLRRSGYGDIDVIRFCLNEVSGFFDYRIKPEAVRLNRLDLCQYIQLGSKAEEEAFLRRVYDVVGSNPDVVRVVDGRGRTYGNLREFGDFSLTGNTLYAHHHRNKYYGCQLAIYRPMDKDNWNHINRRNMVKLELRACGSYLQTGKMYGSDGHIAKLIEKARGGLHGEFQRWLGEYYGEDSMLFMGMGTSNGIPNRVKGLAVASHSGCSCWGENGVSRERANTGGGMQYELGIGKSAENGQKRLENRDFEGVEVRNVEGFMGLGVLNNMIADIRSFIYQKQEKDNPQNSNRMRADTLRHLDLLIDAVLPPGTVREPWDWVLQLTASP